MDIQVYGDKVIVEHETNQVNVTVQNIDLSLIMGQFSLEELLGDYDIADIYSWLEQKMKEDE